MRYSTRRSAPCLAFALALTLLAAGLPGCGAREERVSFNKHIRPIFNKKCLSCHGGVRQMGGFSLLFPEEALAATESGRPAIIPGKHRRSELFRRITHEDPELRMPFEGEPLSKKEVALIAKWIDQGAQWEHHWAFLPPKPVEPPPKSGEWAANDIDLFVEQAMLRRQMNPEPEADRPALLRRLSFDLTGLPPTPEAVEQFLADKAPGAYERAAQRLFDSPHFGERWAAWWLDLARYADSKGYEKDPHRDIWRFRDWVINAFNQDMPFDQFTIEQLAGDLLPNPSTDQLIATAFHRNTMTNTEGGTDDEEFRVVAVIDRVNTTFEVWQATTISCVQCHSHPYDPFRHEDYYRLFALFNNTQDSDLESEFPKLELYQEGPEQEIAATIDFIRDLAPHTQVDSRALTNRRLRQAIFPRLLPDHCDDFHNVSIYADRLTSNWTNNVKSGEGKRFFLQYAQVDLSELEGAQLIYSAGGDDARLLFRTQGMDGPVFGQVDLKGTPGLRGAEYQGQNFFTTIDFPLRAVPGRHDLIVEIVNVSGRMPEGIAMLKELRLRYRGDRRLDTPAWLRASDRLIELRRQADYTPIMRARTPAFERATHLFERGNFLTLGPQVAPSLPPALGTLPATSGEASRLAFARWLASPANPLTARVIANRVWEQLFGAGLVETMEDFGSQGAPPTHPELLDYLASQFSGPWEWRLKRLLREIVLSATYRQSSAAPPEKWALDPYNQWLARGPRFRLSAEQVRDQALVVSGLFNDSLGGRSVMPPQPEGIWQVVYSGNEWITRPEDRHRRALYTYWRRTTPYPSMVAFDSPSREFCVSRRIRTNTPLQALVTLNDPVYVEAAEALAARMRAIGGDDAWRCIQAGYRIALGEEPPPSALSALLELYDYAERQRQAKARPISRQPAAESPRDPLAIAAGAILNLDAFLTKY